MYDDEIGWDRRSNKNRHYDEAYKQIPLKKKLLIVAIIPIAIALLVFLFRTASGRTEMTGDIEAFSYNYGSYFGGYYSYELERRYDGRVSFSAIGGNGVDLDIYTYVDPACLDELARIINETGIYNWNRFSKHDNGLMDGYSFSLDAKYSVGRTLHANGYGKEPSGYDIGHQALTEFFETLSKSYDKSFAEENPGLRGKIDFFVYLYMTPELERKSYSLVKDKDGTVTFSIEVDDQEKNMTVDRTVIQKLEDLINEKELYKWDGFEENVNYAEDSDAFMLLVSYENDKRIDAGGHQNHLDSYEAGHQALTEFFESIAE